jgi:CubicO group peptidase (beta-lactamase class C family)
MKAPLSRRRFVGLAAATTGGLGLGLGRVGGAAPDAGIQARAAEAGRLIESQVRDGTVAAAALLVRQNGFEFVRGYGKAKVDTPFLIASPTKPIAVSAVTLLRERKQLELSDPVRKYLPEFKGGDRDAVTIKHLLNHTSGLPDMLPENVELRRRHAPLGEFVARSCTTPLLFRPGEKVGYQSMGILLAATIVEKIGGQTMPAFLAQHIFSPLRMTQSSLGLGGRRIADLAQCQVPDAERSDWDWNSPYWRNLAAPWGGAHSTVHDLARFLEAFATEAPAPWTPATRQEMLEIQTGPHRPSYGLGWVRQPGAFGKNCSPATFGHFGSTGTVFWHDPASSTTCVLLTTRPAESSKASLLVPVSEIVSRSERTRTL